MRFPGREQLIFEGNISRLNSGMAASAVVARSQEWSITMFEN